MPGIQLSPDLGSLVADLWVMASYTNQFIGYNQSDHMTSTEDAYQS